MQKNEDPRVGTTDDETTVYVCAWPIDKLESLEQNRRWRHIARTYGIALSFSDFGETLSFEGVPYARLFATAALVSQANIGKGYILAMSDALDAQAEK